LAYELVVGTTFSEGFLDQNACQMCRRDVVYVMWSQQETSKVSKFRSRIMRPTEGTSDLLTEESDL